MFNVLYFFPLYYRSLLSVFVNLISVTAWYNHNLLYQFSVGRQFIVFAAKNSTKSDICELLSYDVISIHAYK